MACLECIYPIWQSYYCIDVSWIGWGVIPSNTGSLCWAHMDALSNHGVLNTPLQIGERPILATCSLCLGLAKALINISAVCSGFLQLSMCTDLSSTHLWI